MTRRLQALSTTSSCVTRLRMAFATPEETRLSHESWRISRAPTAASATKMTSTVAPNRGRTASNSSQSTARLSASSCTGSTIEKDGRARTGASLTVSGPARVRQIVVAPGVEHQQRPENLAVIPMAAHMLGDEPRDRGRLEQPARRETGGREALVEHRPEGTAQPARDGHAEALLAARDGRCRQQARGGALEDVLGRPPAQLQPCRHAAR